MRPSPKPAQSSCGESSSSAPWKSSSLMGPPVGTASAETTEAAADGSGDGSWSVKARSEARVFASSSR